MNNLRSTLLVAVTAFVAAACGDKVTVQGPTSATASIKSVTVAPSSATLNIGDQASLTAAVNADAGLATTVTWKSSDASKASVDATGKVTGVAATPGVAVCATSTVDTGKIGCASVIVTGAAAIVPATVSIASITTPGNLNSPVNPAAVTGTVDVKLNIAPGNQTPSRVDVLVGTTVVASQGFTATQAAALRSAADEAIAAQSAFPSVVLSINTAAFNATTGTPNFLNGSYTLGAKLYTVQGGSTSAAANATQTLTFVNVDGFAITTSGGNSAVDGSGFRWTGTGSLTVNALPVMYSGATPGTVNAALSANPAAGSTCGAAVGNVGSATVKTGNVFVITGTMAGLASPAGCNTTFPNVVTITSTSAAGDVMTLVGTGTTPAGVIGTQIGLRWDNVAPPTAGLIVALAVNNRTGNWINDVVVLNTVTSATNLNGAIAAAVVDANVGGAITYNVRVGTTFTLAKTAAPLANATTLNAGTAGSTTNAGWCAIVYTADLLGNTQTVSPTGTCAAPVAAVGYALPAAGVASVPFGVDRAAPTISYSGGLAANAQQVGANIGGEFSVTVADTGLVGNSGMQPATPVIMQVSQRIAAGNGVGTTTALNANGTAATTAGVLTSTGVNAAGNPIYTTAITGVSTAGYYTFAATATDAAGNSASVTPGRVIVYDNGPLVVGAVSSPITVSTIGWTGSAFINDALDIASYWFAGNYNTLPAPFAAAPSTNPPRFAQATSQVNGFNAASFLNTNYATNNAVNLPLAFQIVGAATQYPLSTVNANATNVAGIITNGAAAAAPAVSPALVAFAPAGLTTFPVITNSIASNNISSGVTTAATAGNPASGTLSVVATGPTATFNLPFSRIDWYAANNGGAAGTEWRLIGTSAVSTLVDVGATRTFTWNLAISGATLYTQLGYTATAVTNVIAIGYNASGSIGIINATPYALNIIK
jgi:hypothetical protein